ncbi:MAG: alpha-mannosidase, partial [Egibacteraceae bacterium]
MTTTVHVVPHTHWDREWYLPFQTFRARLVELLDGLIELMADHPDFRFTLDGQLATVDDYLALRPDAENHVRALIADGRLAVGPWQILMDEFCVSGETIVRNLELGWHQGETLGGAMPVGYLPDMFGHIAQMPQILRRAGIRHAVVWRGVPAEVDRHAFVWTAPDGSQVRTEYLVGGYGNAAQLFELPDRLPRKLAAYHDRQRPFFGDDDLLAMVGDDHAIPQAAVATLASGVNAEQADYRLRLQTLRGYLAAPGGD